MADYNPNYMAAYQQYGQTMTAGGGGSNMSGAGSSTMQAFTASQNDDKPTGLGAKPPTTTTTKDDGPSFWERITQAFTDNEVDVTNVYQPSVDPSQVYNQEIFKIAPLASDYVYRAEMSEQTQDMVEQAMGYEPPMTSLAEQMGVMDINSYDPNTGANALNLSQILKLPDDIQDNIFREMHEGKDSLMGGSSVNTLRLVDDSAMTDEEKKQFAPLIKLADDIRNENITSSELPTVLSNNQIKELASKAIAAGTFSRDNVEDDIFYQNLLDAITSAGPQGEPYTLDQPQGEPYTLDQEASLMDALMEGQPTGLMSRPSSFTGASVDVASNMPDWMAELSALEMVNAIQGINEGTVDPETGQKIKSAENVANERMAEMASQGFMSRSMDGKDGDMSIPTQYGTAVFEMSTDLKSTEGTKPHIGEDWENVTLALGIVPTSGLKLDGKTVPSDRAKRGKWLKSNGYVNANGKPTDKFNSATIDTSGAVKDGIKRSDYSSDTAWSSAVINNFKENAKDKVEGFDDLGIPEQKAVIDIAWNMGVGGLEYSGNEKLIAELSKAPEDRKVSNMLEAGKHVYEAGKAMRGLARRKALAINELIADPNQKITNIRQTSRGNKTYHTYVNAQGQAVKTIELGKKHSGSPDGFISVETGEEVEDTQRETSPRPMLRPE